MENSQKRPHYGALDTLRGLCVISMVLYHAMYDLVYLKGFPAPWYGDWPGYLWQQSICWTFILLSGLCWNLSRRHLRRGLVLVGCGAVITLATWLAMPSQLILYGVLNLLGLSALLLIPLDKALRKLPPWLGLAGAGALFFLTRGVPRGYLGFEGLRMWDLPAALYQWDALAVLGFHSPGFSSTDYFPLAPWFFLYLAGYFLWRVLTPHRKVLELLQPGLRPLSFVGRHSLLIYLVHQPLLMVLFWFL